MALRASVFQHLNIGPEVTPGTLVSATKRLLDTRFSLNPNVPTQPFRPVGVKFNTDLTLEKEWSTGTFEGVLGFNDIVYILASALVVPSAPSGGGTAKTWTFIPSGWDPDVIQTYSMDYGSSARAERCGFGVFSGVEINLARNGLTVRGDVFARTMSETATMASTTNVASLVASPKLVTISVGDTVGGLTMLQNCISANIHFRNRVGPAFFLRADQDSYSDIVEIAPDYMAQIQVEHNSVAAGYMADLRNSAQKFCRYLITGPLVQTGINASIQITFPFKFQTPTRGDVDNIFASTFSLMPNYESGTGNGLEIVVINNIAAL